MSEKHHNIETVNTFGNGIAVSRRTNCDSIGRL